MRKQILIIVLTFGFISEGFCQIHQAGDPVGKQYNYTKSLNYISVQQENEPELILEKDVPTALYAGYTIPFLKDDLEKGVWEKTAAGLFTWRIGITNEKAKALNVYFEHIMLRSNEQLFVYSPDYSVVLGAFTNQNNGAYLATELINGNELLVEFSTPYNDKKIPFEISKVGISVLDMSSASRDFGDAGFCEVLVNCPEGDEWQKEKRGLARILVSEGSKLYWCSGSLVNNTLLDAKPYLLTANHCGESAALTDYSNWVFYFLFESEDCEMPLSEPLNKSLSGATLLAHSSNSTNSGSDFKLLLLDDEVPKSYQPYYNGWDWSGESSNTGVTIHHPEGDLKMISTYDQPLVSTNYNNPSPDPTGKYWKVNWIETGSGYGVTEGGSSGAPIFDQGGYILGHLSGGRASCAATTAPDYYGKFSYSWASNGSDSIRQLKPWLDPNNSGVTRLRGSDFDTTLLIADFSASTTQIRLGQSVEFYNRSDGLITQYEWQFPGGEPTFSEAENPPAVKYNSAGKFDVGLYVMSDDGEDSLVKKEYIHVLPTLSPNPSQGDFTIMFGGSIPDDLEISVVDMLGKQAGYHLMPSDGVSLTIGLSENMAGLYLIKMKTDGHTEILKAVLYNE